ncbi:MAG: hypothetical protein ACNYZG_06935 [Gammaproteobacteria bacterium]
MPIRKRKQFITLLASLVIVLAQFGVVVHATNHPFHQEEALCLSFQSAEHDKHAFNAIPVALVNPVLVSGIDVPQVETLLSSFYSNYLSRAPPVLTL